MFMAALSCSNRDMWYMLVAIMHVPSNLLQHHYSSVSACFSPHSQPISLPHGLAGFMPGRQVMVLLLPLTKHLHHHQQQHAPSASPPPSPPPAYPAGPVCCCIDVPEAHTCPLNKATACPVNKPVAHTPAPPSPSPRLPCHRGV
jgi:hypothetical protein